jgi:PadR family transcriptional regulator, regulatory protein PadR
LDSYSAVNSAPRTKTIDVFRHFSYSVGQMAKVDSVGQFEQVVMTAILTLGENAYGVTIHRKVGELSHPRSVSLGAVYVTLDRLEDKGFISSWLSEPTTERGGRSKRHYQMQALGERVLRESINAAQRIFEALEETWGEFETPGRKKWKPVRQS